MLYKLIYSYFNTYIYIYIVYRIIFKVPLILIRIEFVSKLWTENFNKEGGGIYITMIICIFRIDLFVSLLISTRQIKERVTSTQVINYSRGQRKSQRRMKRRKRGRRISRVLLRLLTLLLPLIKIVNDVRLIFSPIMNKCMYFFRNFAG